MTIMLSYKKPIKVLLSGEESWGGSRKGLQDQWEAGEKAQGPARPAPAEDLNWFPEPTPFDSQLTVIAAL